MNRVLFDIEIYSNFALFGWFDLASKKYFSFQHHQLDQIAKLIPKSYIIGFNSQHYDLPILKYALAHKGSTTLLQQLKLFSTYIIEPDKIDKDKWEKHQWEKVKEGFDNCKYWSMPNLDLKNVLGGRLVPSLKKLAARLHLDEIESLPIHPDAVLTDEQKLQLIEYNKIDIKNTGRLLEHCEERLALRESLTAQFRCDVRSLSDAQIAERVICSRLKGSGTKFDCSHPRPTAAIIKKFHFDTPQLQRFYDRLMKTWVKFTSSYNPTKGKRVFKKEFLEGESVLSEFIIDDIIPAVSFRFGGLHSRKTKKAIIINEENDAVQGQRKE